MISENLQPITPEDLQFEITKDLLMPLSSLNLKKPLPDFLKPIRLQPNPQEKTESPKTESLIGKRAFNRLKALAKTPLNQRYNQILFLETGSGEENPFDFDSILITKISNNSSYFIGFDNKGRVYFFSNKQDIYDLFGLIIPTHEDQQRETMLKRLRLKLFKMFKDNQHDPTNIFLIKEPDSDEKIEEMIENLIASYINLFRMLNAR